MVHIIITVRSGWKSNFAAKTTHPQIVLHHFTTKNTSKDEASIGHILRTLLQPFLRELAKKENAKFEIIE